MEMPREPECFKLAALDGPGTIRILAGYANALLRLATDHDGLGELAASAAVRGTTGAVDGIGTAVAAFRVRPGNRLANRCAGCLIKGFVRIGLIGFVQGCADRAAGQSAQQNAGAGGPQLAFTAADLAAEQAAQDCAGGTADSLLVDRRSRAGAAIAAVAVGRTSGQEGC